LFYHNDAEILFKRIKYIQIFILIKNFSHNFLLIVLNEKEKEENWKSYLAEFAYGDSLESLFSI